MNKKILLVLCVLLVAVMAMTACNSGAYADAYTIPMVDLDRGVVLAGEASQDDVLKTIDDATLEEYKDMFKHKTIVADKNDFGKDYMAHPDSILLKRQKKGSDSFEFTDEVMTMFPLAHGKGELKAKFSYDGGMNYTETLGNTPATWVYSQETPTLYRLTFTSDNVSSDDDKILLVSGNPYWPNDSSYKANGFNASLSSPSIDANGDKVEGRVWTEFETWYGHGEKTCEENIIKEPQGKKDAYDPIVAMSSLTRLKERDASGNMVWANKWMGLFHDHKFNCYKTILTFEDDAHTIMNWSKPVRYFEAYDAIEKKSNMCEVECIRSDAGKGDKLAIITRSNSKKINSLVSFSTDEGETWSEPRELPTAINGERHKAEWVKVHGEDKLFITFRSIDRSENKRKTFKKKKWMSEGYVAWVGDWADLENGTEGDFRVKIAHTYLEKQDEISRDAHADTGYAGNVVLPNGKVATCSYGRFSADNDSERGKTTYIVGRVIDVEALYDIVSKIK